MTVGNVAVVEFTKNEKAEKFTATAVLFVQGCWNKSVLLLTFVTSDKSKSPRGLSG